MNTELGLKNWAVRDLHWALCSAPLMQHALDGIYAQEQFPPAWFHALDANPQALLDHLADKNLQMIGPYFEALWEFYLIHSGHTRLVAKNLQVFAGKRTLGEFDFIYFCERSGEHKHLEVALKYFLGQAAAAASTAKVRSAQSAWLGPQCRDRLDLKYAKLLDQQSQLSRSEAGQEALAALGVDKVDAQICLRGCLFYPFEASMGALNPPQEVHKQHNRGLWLHQRAFPAFLESHPAQSWQLLAKPHWLARRVCPEGEDMTSKALLERLDLHFAAKAQPLLISGCDDDLRLFIVPDAWPA